MLGVIDDIKLQNIAEAIREKTNKETTYTPNDMAIGVNEVYEAGKKAEQKKFWEIFQNNGNRDNYIYAFGYGQFRDDIYNPEYDLKGNLQGAFNQSSVTDTKVRLLNVTNLYQAFRWSLVKRIVELNVSEKTTNWAGAFDYAQALSDVTISGELSYSANFSSCPLAVESMKSIITHLKNYAGTESAGAYTLTLKDTCKTLMAEQGEIEELGGKTYDAYIADIGWNLA